MRKVLGRNGDIDGDNNSNIHRVNDDNIYGVMVGNEIIDKFLLCVLVNKCSGASPSHTTLTPLIHTHRPPAAVTALLLSE